MKIPKKYLGRQAEITESFIQEMNKHMDDFMAGRAEKMIHIKDFAEILCLHPAHISNVIKLYSGHHPCFFYEERIMKEAKIMLADPSMTVAAIAMKLTYDSSNFTKFFKEYERITPSEYRRLLKESSGELEVKDFGKSVSPLKT